MSPQTKQIARIIFRNRILEANAQEYENLFTKVMGYSRSDFQPVKPQGAFGDRKNDGFEKNSGRYFQVFAPEDFSTKETKVISKINEDFKGLHDYWQSQGVGIREFHFVLNDKFKGAYPSTDFALNELKKNYPTLQVSEKFLAKHLENEFFLLSDDQIFVIIGGVPDPENIETIDYGVLGEVIKFIDQQPTKPFEMGKLVAPPFDKKITFNGLVGTKSFLENAWYQCGVLDSFFEFEGNFTKDFLRDKLNSVYVEAREKFANPTTPDTGDQIFISILENIIPSDINSVDNKRYREAAGVLMATFFDSCDIYEEPEIGLS